MPRPRVALDLTTLHPSGGESWSDDFRVRFVAALVRLLAAVDFVVLLRPGAAAPLVELNAPNARHHVVAEPNRIESVVARLEARLARRFGRSRLTERLASSRRLGPALRRWRPGVLAQLHANLVFCPFTSAAIVDPSVPLLAAVHDLQHVTHPHLLSSTERATRERAFDATWRHAARIVCSSPSLRAPALQRSGLSPDRVSSVAPGPLILAGSAPTASSAATLARHRLLQNGFVFTTATCEPRGNERAVLTAWSMFRAQRPRSELRLVALGGPPPGTASLAATAEQMGLGTTVQVVAALDPGEARALIQASRAVLEPALYETIGDTVLQAMQVGRPVLCSQIPALAELTGGAALAFDAHRPADLAANLARIDQEPELVESLGALGQQQVARMDSPERVAEAYLQAFRETLTTCPASR